MAADVDKYGITAELWALLDLLLELSLLNPRFEFSTLVSKVLAPDELNGRKPELVESRPVCDPALGLVDEERDDEVNTVDPEAGTKLLNGNALESGDVAALVIG
ncbi:MAG: hypothetical protein Q9178_006660 [Gyalolechia marmorata]